MGQLRRAIALIAATLVSVSPSAATITEFQICKSTFPGFEERIIGAAGAHDRIHAGLFIGNSNQLSSQAWCGRVTTQRIH